jgi:hypothetical protein
MLFISLLCLNIGSMFGGRRRLTLAEQLGSVDRDLVVKCGHG